jgi:hypothetical protein
VGITLLCDMTPNGKGTLSANKKILRILFKMHITNTVLRKYNSVSSVRMNVLTEEMKQY